MKQIVITVTIKDKDFFEYILTDVKYIDILTNRFLTDPVYWLRKKDTEITMEVGEDE